MKKSGKKISFFKKLPNNHGTPLESVTVTGSVTPTLHSTWDYKNICLLSLPRIISSFYITSRSLIVIPDCRGIKLSLRNVLMSLREVIAMIKEESGDVWRYKEWRI